MIYFLWFVTLKFSLPEYMITPIKNAIMGSGMELKNLAGAMLKREKIEENNNENN